MERMGDSQAGRVLRHSVVKFFSTPYGLEESFFHPVSEDFLRQAATEWEDKKYYLASQVQVDEKELREVRIQEASCQNREIANSVNAKFLQSLKNWSILGSRDCSGFSHLIMRKLIGGSLPRIKRAIEEHNEAHSKVVSSAEYHTDYYDYGLRSMLIDSDVVNKAEAYIESLCSEIKMVLESGDTNAIEQIKKGEFGSRFRRLDKCMLAITNAAHAAFITGLDSEWIHEHHVNFNTRYKLSKIYSNREEWVRSESDRLSKSFHEQFATGDMEAGAKAGLSEGLLKSWISGRLAPTHEVASGEAISPDSPVFGLEIVKLIELVRDIGYRTGQSRQFREFISELKLRMHEISQAVEKSNGR